MDYNSFPIDSENLGEPYNELAELIGLEDTIKLSECVSGNQIIMKTKYDLLIDYPDIVDCIGADKTNKVVQYFAGESLYFPMLRRALRKQILTQIIEEYNGTNHVELAKKYGYTTRNIYRIIAKSKS